MLRTVLQALAYCHENSIVHRDLKVRQRNRHTHITTTAPCARTYPPGQRECMLLDSLAGGRKG